jgi:hypothetical protein
MKNDGNKKSRLAVSATMVLLMAVLPLSSIGVAYNDPCVHRDQDWNFWSNAPHMFAIPKGNVGIGEEPPSNAKLFVKTNNPHMGYAILAEGGLGIKSVSTLWEGTGITGEGGHAGVCGNGYIGLLGFGFYGGWFNGRGYFSSNVGIGTTTMEHKLHVNGAINLDPIAEPTNPSTGFIIYCDTADGTLKAKASTGTITVLATP